MTSPFIIQNDYDVINSAVRALLGQVTEGIALKKSVCQNFGGCLFYLNVEENKKSEKKVKALPQKYMLVHKCYWDILNGHFSFSLP